MAEFFNHQHVVNENANVATEQYKWQWHCGSKWKDYRTGDSMNIEHGYKSKTIVHIIVNGMQYKIDTLKCDQINVLTACKRNIRRVPINCSDNTYYGSKNYKMEGKTQKTKIYTTPQQHNNSSSTKSEIHWQWLHTNETKWENYDAETYKLLEQKYNSKDDKIFNCKIKYHNTNEFALYSINLATMTQSNVSTGKIRTIRRINATNMKTIDYGKININTNGNYGLQLSNITDSNIESELKEIVDSMDLNVPKNVVAKNFASEPHQTVKCSNQMKDITQILMNKQQRTQILNKAKWHDSNKIPILNKRCNKKRLSLSLEKQEFIQRVLGFGDANGSVNLVPILVEGDKNKIVKFLWIVTIEKCKNVSIDIGIALQLTKTIKKVKTVVPVGIYLDINEGNKLVNSDKFNLILDELKIGSLENKIKDGKRKAENKIQNELLIGEVYKWQWENGNGYIDFDSKISNEIEILYQNQAETYGYRNTVSQQMCTIKFNELKMYNEHSQKCNNVRRVLMGYKDSGKVTDLTMFMWIGPKETNNRKVFANKIMVLYAVRMSKMLSGINRAVTGGICFVESIQAATYNVNSDNGVLITAKVFIGKEYEVKNSTNKQFTFEYLQNIGYDSIYIPIGEHKYPQRVVYNWDQVCVIKQEPLTTQK
eukprot:425305_1